MQLLFRLSYLAYFKAKQIEVLTGSNRFRNWHPPFLPEPTALLVAPRADKWFVRYGLSTLPFRRSFTFKEDTISLLKN
jgi:hypothetical protein